MTESCDRAERTFGLLSVQGLRRDDIAAGRMNEKLRGPRLHGLIAQVTKSHRYHSHGPLVANGLVLYRRHSRILRANLALVILNPRRLASVYASNHSALPSRPSTPLTVKSKS
jgi:hypothetical protein